ncbi:MAG: hypothetical protein ABIG11_01200 [bacterium]
MSAGWELMGRADLFAGQYFFEKSAGSVNGYGDLDLQLARSFSSSSGLFISERSIYTGFKQVNELAGGGTLFQQSLDNSLGGKWIRRYEGGYSLKPRAGVKSQLFRETSDEKWGKRLYDFWRYEAGVALERKTRWGLSIPWTWQISWDAYYTRYVRFKSLSSQFGAEMSAPDPGSRVLDSLTNQFSYTGELDLPGFNSLFFMYSLSMISFPDQKMIGSQGQYLDSSRSDSFHTLALGYSKRFSDLEALSRIRPLAGLNLTFSSLNSNQNHFDTDPKRLKFVDSYYDYSEIKVSPVVRAVFLESRLSVKAGYDFAFRYYTGRLSQTGAGDYTTGRLRQFLHGVSLDIAYPLWSSLDLKLRGFWMSSGSNNKYEQVYRYNYESSNYFAGVQWRI